MAIPQRAKYMTKIQVKSFTPEEYHQLTEIGFFKEDDHIQLINGELIEIVSKGRAHETCLRNLLRELPKMIGDRGTLQSQAPITIPTNSEPYQNKQGEFGYANRRIVLPNQVISLPCFPDLLLDLSK
jgi:Uma2 family endonuclease